MRKLFLVLVFSSFLFLSGCVQQTNSPNATNSLETVLQQVDSLDEGSASYSSQLNAIKTQTGLSELDGRVLSEYVGLKLEVARARSVVGEKTNSFNPSTLQDAGSINEFKSTLGIARESVQNARNSLDSFKSNNPSVGVAKTEASMAKLELLVSNADSFASKRLDELPKKMKSGLAASGFDSAKKIVLDKIVSGKKGVRVFSTKELLSQGIEVSERQSPKRTRLVWETDSKAWFFWIDDVPGQPFGHDTRFVFVFEDGEYIVFSGEWWPVIDGKEYWPSWVVDGPDLVYEDLVALQPALDSLSFQVAGGIGSNVLGPLSPLRPERTPCPCGLTPNVYTIIAQGNNDSMFYQSVRNVKDAMQRRGAVDSAVHGGFNDSVVYLGDRNNSDADVDKWASKDALKGAINDLAGRVKCCDVVLVYVAGHGGFQCDITWVNYFTGSVSTEIRTKNCPVKGSSEWGIWTASDVVYTHVMDLGADELVSWELDEMLDALKNCNTHVVIDSCHSGAALDDLKGKGRTIELSSDAEHSSWGSNSKGMSGAVGLVEGLDGAANADENGDGSTSLDESMRHSRNTNKNRLKGTLPAGQDEDVKPQFWSSNVACDCGDDCLGHDVIPHPPVASPTVTPTATPSAHPTDFVFTPTPTPTPQILPTPTAYVIPPTPTPTPSPSDPAAPDQDHDGVFDYNDNCVSVYNPGQNDEDGDGIGSACDLSPISCSAHLPSTYSEVAAEGASLTQEECNGFLEVPTQTCTTTCTYVRYQSWTWGSNKYACCFRDINHHACSDCPGQNPVCPLPAVVCTGPNGP